jgi:hypothetical protein
MHLSLSLSLEPHAVKALCCIIHAKRIDNDTV